MGFDHLNFKYQHRKRMTIPLTYTHLQQPFQVNLVNQQTAPQQHAYRKQGIALKCRLILVISTAVEPKNKSNIFILAAQSVRHVLPVHQYIFTWH